MSDVTAQENQRLRREVKELHARVTALETSRWWRLHPRFALERLRPRRTRDDDRPPVATTASAVTTRDATTQRFRAEVVERGRFSQDWFTVHAPIWDGVLRELDGRAANVLELGSFEGLSACFVLWRLPDARVTCVDTFAGRPVWDAYDIESRDLEATFDENVALVDAARVRKLAGKTHDVLPGLVDAGERFDLVYVDASHRALDALVDAALSWQLLSDGGIAIFDDYGAVPLGENPMDRPGAAIDAFLRVIGSQAEVVSNEKQLIVRKTAP